MNEEPTISFGKYKGKKYIEIPTEYLAWILGYRKIGPCISLPSETPIDERTDFEFTNPTVFKLAKEALFNKKECLICRSPISANDGQVLIHESCLLSRKKPKEVETPTTESKQQPAEKETLSPKDNSKSLIDLVKIIFIMFQLNCERQKNLELQNEIEMCKSEIKTKDERINKMTADTLKAHVEHSRQLAQLKEEIKTLKSQLEEFTQETNIVNGIQESLEEKQNNLQKEILRRMVNILFLLFFQQQIEKKKEENYLKEKQEFADFAAKFKELNFITNKIQSEHHISVIEAEDPSKDLQENKLIE